VAVKNYHLFQFVISMENERNLDLNRRISRRAFLELGAGITLGAVVETLLQPGFYPTPKRLLGISSDALGARSMLGAPTLTNINSSEESPPIPQAVDVFSSLADAQEPQLMQIPNKSGLIYPNSDTDSPISSIYLGTSQEKGPEINEPEYQAEFQAARAKILSHKSTFGNIFRESYDGTLLDFDKYFPFYHATAKKFGPKTPWFLIWIVHEEETSASRGIRNNGTTPGSSVYVGAGQRDPRYWPQSVVNKAGKGLEYLAELPQRARTDWKELAFVGWYFKTHQSKHKKLNLTRDIYKPLIWYSADGPAVHRYHQYLELRRIFGDKTA
jgi:hypothetical protein